jgi:hypothetical protein
MEEATMSDNIWLVVDNIWCDRMKAEASVLEERVFADDTLAGPNRPYQVRARKCSFGLDCNLIGYPCRNAFNNPNYDPFAD